MSKANYVDNDLLHQEIVAWLDRLNENEQERIPEFVGDAIQKIAYGLGSYWKFVNYTQTWKEEMIGDAIINCVKYLSNYNPEKYDNPHAYITMCCYSAMQQRIKKEKLQQVTKYKYFSENFDVDAEEFDADITEEFMTDVMEKIDSFEKNKRERKLKLKQKREEEKEDRSLDI